MSALLVLLMLFLLCLGYFLTSTQKIIIAPVEIRKQLRLAGKFMITFPQARIIALTSEGRAHIFNDNAALGTLSSASKPITFYLIGQPHYQIDDVVGEGSAKILFNTIDPTTQQALRYLPYKVVYCVDKSLSAVTNDLGRTAIILNPVSCKAQLYIEDE